MVSELDHNGPPRGGPSFSNKCRRRVGFSPNTDVATLYGKKPLTRLATLATLSPGRGLESNIVTALSLGERVSWSRRSHQPIRDG
ncbi:hypothetical protein SBA2_230010 [Acidobacteriia bacterium SbA2]|nr:hypothetical protein SBA2_230010 [Acidobacteriia bacterium SbA2]